MATFHAIQMDDPLESRDKGSMHDDMFRSATVAQSSLQIRLGKKLHNPVSIEHNITKQTGLKREPSLENLFVKARTAVFFTISQKTALLRSYF